MTDAQSVDMPCLTRSVHQQGIATYGLARSYSSCRKRLVLSSTSRPEQNMSDVWLSGKVHVIRLGTDVPWKIEPRVLTLTFFLFTPTSFGGTKTYHRLAGRRADGLRRCRDLNITVHSKRLVIMSKSGFGEGLGLRGDELKLAASLPSTCGEQTLRVGQQDRAEHKRDGVLFGSINRSM